MRHSPEKIQEAFDSLPDDLYEAMYQIDVDDIVLQIGRKYGVHIDKQGNLKGAVVLVLIGLEKASDFRLNIKSQLGIDPESEAELISEINEEIFHTVREEYKKIRNKNNLIPLEKRLSENDINSEEKEILEKSKIHIEGITKDYKPEVKSVIPKLSLTKAKVSTKETTEHVVTPKEKIYKANDPYHEPV
jgi:hypothetical protein